MAEESKLVNKVKEKEAEIKFTEEEMTKIKEIQQIYIDAQQLLGQLSISRLRLEQQLDQLVVNENELKGRFIDNQKIEKKFIDEITEKYGDGTLNPETGIFTSNKSE